MFTYLWNVIYEYPVVKSVGLNLCSLLGSSSSSSVDARSFGGVVILSLSLKLNFVISSLIVGTFKSARKSLLDIYRGEFTIARRTLFWYLCNISMSELLAVPQRGIPYVQMSFRIVLYMSDLFYIHSSDFLPSIDYICWNFNPSCFLLAYPRYDINMDRLTTRACLLVGNKTKESVGKVRGYSMYKSPWVKVLSLFRPQASLFLQLRTRTYDGSHRRKQYVTMKQSRGTFAVAGIASPTFADKASSKVEASLIPVKLSFKNV